MSLPEALCLLTRTHLLGTWVNRGKKRRAEAADSPRPLVGMPLL
jgi:hypothetical protein